MSTLLALLPALAFAEPEKLVVAVAPFANGGASKADDYIGFQVAEYAASALAGYPSVTVVERSALDKLLSEQELQLSGLAEAGGAAKVGGLANAAQVLVGSFVNDAAAKKLSITGRLVDVASGTVLGSASVAGSPGSNPAPLYRDFAFKLLSSVKGYGVTVAVEARVATLSDDDAAVSADYARALAASFAKNDAEAKKYLERVVTSERVSISSYVDAAKGYSSAMTRIEGGGMYAKLVAAQMDQNAELMAQVEPLTQYRNTLKVLAARLDGYLSADAFSVKTEGEESMQLGAASAVIGLPPIRVELRAEARAGVERLFAEQDVVALSDAGISFQRQPPAGKLLSEKALAGLFDLSASANAGFSVVFHDKGGEELYRLDSAPVAAFSLGKGASSFGASGPFSLVEAAPRDGWAYRPDGKVEVQARALRDLAGLKVLPRAASFSKRIYLPSAGETRWKSLVLHAYRKNYLKLTVDGDPCPQIKDLVIADSFFETEDPELGTIPIVPADGRRAGYARLAAVVYFGDRATTSVRAAWSGPIAGDSKLFSGPLGPTSVLRFDAPTACFSAGIERLSVSVGLSAARTAKVELSLGKSWKADVGASVLAISAGTLYAGVRHDDIGGLCALSAADGKALWKSRSGGASILAASGGKLYACDGVGKVFALDAASGKELWRADSSADAFALGEGMIFTCNSGRTRALDAATGKALWESSLPGAALLFSDGKLYVGKDHVSALDAASGGTLWTVRDIGVSSLTLSGATLYAAMDRANSRGQSCLFALDAATGKELWRDEPEGSAMLLLGKTLYVGGRNTLAFDAGSGNKLWRSDAYASALILRGGALYCNGCVLDSASGKKLWANFFDTYVWTMVAEGGTLYLGGLLETYALDLSLIERD